MVFFRERNNIADNLSSFINYGNINLTLAKFVWLAANYNQ